MRTKYSFVRILFPGLFLFPVLAHLAAADVQLRPDPLNLMKASHEASKVGDSKAETEFRLIAANGKVRLQQAETITRRDPETGATSRLARFVAPADVKGTAVLTIERAQRDDDIWLFLPALEKVRRLQGNKTREAYMGTDLSYGDVIGHSPDDWIHRIIGDDMIDGIDCWIVESLPQTDLVAKTSGYSKRVSWIRSDNAMPVRADLFDRSGKLMKRIIQNNIRKVATSPDRWQAMDIEVENIRTRHRTEVRFRSYEANTGLDSDLFTPRALEQTP